MNVSKFTPSNMLKVAANVDVMKTLTSPKAGESVGQIAVASNVAKDALGCYYYVTQSLNNERIPQEKRKFVASLDLANGILMIATQLAIGIPVAKNSGKWFKALSSKVLTKKNLDKLFEQVKKSEKFQDIGRVSFNKAVENVEKVAKNGFVFLTTLIGTTIIAKRAVVPFISTPLATWFKNKFMADEAPTKDMKAAQDLMFKSNPQLRGLYLKFQNQKLA